MVFSGVGHSIISINTVLTIKPQIRLIGLYTCSDKAPTKNILETVASQMMSSVTPMQQETKFCHIHFNQAIAILSSQSLFLSHAGGSTHDVKINMDRSIDRITAEFVQQTDYRQPNDGSDYKYCKS